LSRLGNVADLFTPDSAETPAEFADPEGTAELWDPELAYETSSARLRDLWADWKCADGPGRFANPEFFGKRIGGVPRVAVDAFEALETALKATGYKPHSRWAYNCRKIKGSDAFSLHSYGIAIDIDPADNPFTEGDPFAGKLQPIHVKAVLAIRNAKGKVVWSWGGNWRKPDRMHFQIDQGPDDVDIDWLTVAGASKRTSALTNAGPAAAAEEADRSRQNDEKEEAVLVRDSEGPAVEYFQQRLLAWRSDVLPEWGADGHFGAETEAAVAAFQSAYGLDSTGRIDGITAALLQADRA
jgi:hypothetical protein